MTLSTSLPCRVSVLKIHDKHSGDRALTPHNPTTETGRISSDAFATFQNSDVEPLKTNRWLFQDPGIIYDKIAQELIGKSYYRKKTT